MKQVSLISWQDLHQQNILFRDTDLLSRGNTTATRALDIAAEMCLFAVDTGGSDMCFGSSGRFGRSVGWWCYHCRLLRHGTRVLSSAIWRWASIWISIPVAWRKWHITVRSMITSCCGLVMQWLTSLRRISRIQRSLLKVAL